MNYNILKPQNLLCTKIIHLKANTLTHLFSPSNYFKVFISRESVFNEHYALILKLLKKGNGILVHSGRFYVRGGRFNCTCNYQRHKTAKISPFPAI